MHCMFVLTQKLQLGRCKVCGKGTLIKRLVSIMLGTTA
jgi:hypothetical protein